MKRTEFRKLAVSCGYATSATVTEFFRKYPKKEYTEKDLETVYHMNGYFADIKRATKRKG